MLILIATATVAVALGGLPPAAITGWLLLGVVTGGLVGVWTWLTGDAATNRPLDVAARTAVAAGAAGLTLGGVALALGPATPAVIVAATTTVVSWTVAARRRSDVDV